MEINCLEAKKAEYKYLEIV